MASRVWCFVPPSGVSIVLCHLKGGLLQGAFPGISHNTEPHLSHSPTALSETSPDRVSPSPASRGWILPLSDAPRTALASAKGRHAVVSPISWRIAGETESGVRTAEPMAGERRGAVREVVVAVNAFRQSARCVFPPCLDFFFFRPVQCGRIR